MRPEAVFSGKNIRASKWCVNIIRNPTIFLFQAGLPNLYKKCRFNMAAPFIFFLLYYTTCTILYVVDVVKNSENIEIYEKA